MLFIVVHHRILSVEHVTLACGRRNLSGDTAGINQKDRKMKSQYKLAERAVLMRLSIGLPGENRQDKPLTESVKGEHGLGAGSGKWIKQLYPTEALACIKKLDNEARAYHAAVTLPFDAGIGILPAALIKEHADRMRQYAGMRAALVESHFLAKYQDWVDWARKEHNGTFDGSLYPGVDALREKFYFKTEPLPVPDAQHFQGTLSSLLGVDAESVNIRVQDAMVEAQRELMARLIAPVKAMADKLSEAPKVDVKTGQPKDDIVFRDTLVGNVQQIAELALKLNIFGDANIDKFCAEMAALTRYTPKVLREDKATRAEAAAKAADLFRRLDGYTL
jgi:hypothetical protein